MTGPQAVYTLKMREAMLFNIPPFHGGSQVLKRVRLFIGRNNYVLGYQMQSALF